MKGIAGFYYVNVEGCGLFECKAKGIFRNRNITPLVGDDVSITIMDTEQRLGNITEILPRKNALSRPAVANVDQAFVIFATAEPEPNLNLLDRFLVMMQKQQVDTVICFNKTDMVPDRVNALLQSTYQKCGCRLLFCSAKLSDGLTMIRDVLKGKTTVLAGPSGVGKSTIMNLLQPLAGMETGQVSEKIKRGKHTTRHSELIYLEEDTYLMDTPGFSSLFVSDMEKEDLKDYYVEFNDYRDKCRFLGCLHLKEPGCAVKAALEQEEISKIRYDNYKQMYEELKNQKKY